MPQPLDARRSSRLADSCFIRKAPHGPPGSTWLREEQVNIRFFKTNHWLTGVGEEAMAQIPPAIVNAVFKVTGKRVRNLPLRNHDLIWA